MRRYLARRLLVAVPSLLIASLIVFTLPRLIPGDVVALMLEEKAYARDLQELRAKLGLDRPLHVQYLEWLGRAARGDLGESLWTRRPVAEELARRLPVTVELGLLAIAVRPPHRPPHRGALRDPAGHAPRLRRAERRRDRPLGPGLLAGNAGRHPAGALVGLATRLDVRRVPRGAARPRGAASPARPHPRDRRRRRAHASDARHAPRGPAPGLRAHRVGEGAPRARRSSSSTGSGTR